MPDLIETLGDAPRLILDAQMRPVIGSTFQPTGFPNLGAARYQQPDGTEAVLVESVQSLTNHLEAIGWDAPAAKPVELVARLPYIEVRHRDDEAYLASSRTEPHRLASAYVRNAVNGDGERGLDWTASRLGLAKGRPLDYPAIYRAVFELDPLVLLHGVFFSDEAYSGNPKIRRVTTAVLEAEGVREAVSGGVKRDDVAVKTDQATGQTAKEGYGFVPFGRTEFTAERISFSAVVDLAQLRGYGLPEPAHRLLVLLAIWELRSLLEEPLRLRTRCDLDRTDIAVRKPAGLGDLPACDDLSEEIRKAIDVVELEHEGPWTLQWAPAKGVSTE